MPRGAVEICRQRLTRAHFERTVILAEVFDPAAPVALPPPGGEVRFEDVTFSYGGGRPVLDHFDLTIPAGQSVALVGSTASASS